MPLAAPPRRTRRRITAPLRAFLHAEETGGVILLVATVAALVWANSPAAAAYTRLWETGLTIGAGPLSVAMDLRHWINDGLMALFFLVVGMEIKRELVTGELRRLRAAATPALAALGGVLVPVAVFTAITSPGAERAGWGIPMATDIAFVVGVLALLGSRVPAGARLFLLSIAIVDDLMAIGVIAVFYTATLQAAWLAVAGLGLAGALALRFRRVTRVWPFLPLGLLVWYALHESGVHATLAGVLFGLLTPARPVRGVPVMARLERRLHPVSAFLVIPLFALANAGVPVTGPALAAAAGSGVTWGVTAGLVVGKLLGIALVTLAALRLGIGALPDGMRPRHLWGAAALAGIGFTVSLFITDLAYADPGLAAEAKLGILAGSLLAAVLGVLLLLLAGRERKDGSRGERPDAADSGPAADLRPLREHRPAAKRPVAP